MADEPILMLKTPKEKVLLKLADPPTDAMGRIRSIVMSAHKWGGDGHRPIFRKIRARLVAEHPEVIAKAFGGSPEKAAGWVKARWYQLRGRPVPGPNAKLSMDEDLYNLIPDQMVALADEQGVTHELFCEDGGDVVESDGLVWKTAARTGSWKMSPLPGGKPLVIDKPLLEDVQNAFSEGAWEHVTVPLSHKDRVDENTGYVRALKIEDDPARPGQALLRAGIKFTEPEIEQRVKRGSIANCSVGISLSGVKRTEDGKFFPRVLKHIALTNQPWLNGLTPFGEGSMAASLASYELEDDLIMASLDRLATLDEAEVEALGDLLADYGDGEGNGNGNGGDGDDDEPDASQDKGAWPDDLDVDAVRSRIRDALPAGSYIIGQTFDKALCRLAGGEDDSAYIAGYTVDKDGAVTVEPQADWQQVERAWLPASLALAMDATVAVGSLKKGDKFAHGGDTYTHAGKHPTKAGHITGKKKRKDGSAFLKAIPEKAQVRKADSGGGPGDYGLSLAQVEALEAESIEPGTILALGWMPASVKESTLDDGDFAVVYKEGDTKVRKLPYKIHGTVHEGGWRAAWSMAAKTHLPSGVSLDSVRKKLLANKPKGIEVNASLGPVVLLTVPTNPEGGEIMGEGEGNEETLALTRDDLNDMIAEAIRQDRSERDVELSQATERLHAMDVRERCAELQRKGHAPTVVAKAREYMLADTRGADILTLSQEQDEGDPVEIGLSVSDIVNGLLDSIPTTSLTAKQVMLAASADDEQGEPEDPKAVAERITKDLIEGPSSHVAGVGQGA